MKARIAENTRELTIITGAKLTIMKLLERPEMLPKMPHKIIPIIINMGIPRKNAVDIFRS